MDTPISFPNKQAEIFNAIGHPARLEILSLLRSGEACVCHIQARLNYRQAYISQHLNILRQAGLVHRRKAGQYWYYQLTDPAIMAIIDQSAELLPRLNSTLPQVGNIPPAITIPLLCRCPECCTNEISNNKKLP